MKLALINIEVIRYFMHIFVDFFATTGTKLRTEKSGPLPLLRKEQDAGSDNFVYTGRPRSFQSLYTLLSMLCT